jgi:predicted NBD/HSP70 family sugar kinase
MVRAAAAQPGVPSLLRVLNDRTALELLLDHGATTRAELGKRTGLSRVTASESLARLEARGLVEVVGRRSAGRGPDAEVYAVRHGLGRAVGMDMRADSVTAAVAAVTGETLTTVSDDAHGHDVVERAERVLSRALAECSVEPGEVLAAVVAVPGVVDPDSRDVRFSFDLPDAGRAMRGRLESRLGIPVVLENDVNAAALAETQVGAAAGHSDVVLVWLSTGVGMAAIVDGRLHQGSAGAAGEIGYLQVPGAPPHNDDDPRAQGPYQRLVGAVALAGLARELGVPIGASSDPTTVATAVASAVHDESTAFLDEVARRIALGVSSVCAVLDPALVVLSGEVGVAGGDRLAALVAEHVRRIAPVDPSVCASLLGDSAVLRGATQRAVLSARQSLLARVGEPVDG